MPFDPSLPAPNSPLQSQVIRDQLQALFNLINGIVTVTAAQVDGVNTLPAGSPANVNVSVNGSTLHLSFDIPRGNDGSEGPQGIPGNNGSDGAPGLNGNDGQQGPPFAQAVVDSVNTLPAGSAAAVSVSFDGTNVHFTFNIPQGQDGPMGAAGEVSQSQLDNAINGTSNNSNGVGTLDSSFGDPASEELRNKLNELITALRR